MKLSDEQRQYVREQFKEAALLYAETIIKVYDKILTSVPEGTSEDVIIETYNSVIKNATAAIIEQQGKLSSSLDEETKRLLEKLNKEL